MALNIHCEGERTLHATISNLLITSKANRLVQVPRAMASQLSKFDISPMMAFGQYMIPRELSRRQT